LQAKGCGFEFHHLHMNKLDLHGIRHADVRNKTIRFIESNWGSNEWIEIVTGNSYKMKDLVMDVVNEYDLTLEYPIFDTGYLRIFME
jgi:hypothetical protein